MMSEFEFLAVFVSVVIGLGVTHLLMGVGRIIHDRDRVSLDPVHAAWTLNVFLLLVINWWVAFSWRTHESWSFGDFLILILWSVSMYLLAVILYPLEQRVGEPYAAVFERNRRWFLGTLAVNLLLDLAQTWMRGELFVPRSYLPFVLHYIALTLIGMFTASPRYHRLFAGWMLVSLTTWALVVRRLLEH